MAQWTKSRNGELRVLGAIVANGLSRPSPQLFSRINNALIGIVPKPFKPLQSQALGYQQG